MISQISTFCMSFCIIQKQHVFGQTEFYLFTFLFDLQTGFYNKKV